MKVVITAAAKADLIEIGDFIRINNPNRAMTFVDELLELCLSLGDMPRAYPLVPRYENFGVRRRVYGGYLIFYRIHENRVEVLHVLHGVREYETLLFPDSSLTSSQRSPKGFSANLGDFQKFNSPSCGMGVPPVFETGVFETGGTPVPQLGNLLFGVPLRKAAISLIACALLSIIPNS